MIVSLKIIATNFLVFIEDLINYKQENIAEQKFFRALLSGKL
jgi:hypothetical protein